jgi:hypothetical protein
MLIGTCKFHPEREFELELIEKETDGLMGR